MGWIFQVDKATFAQVFWLQLMQDASIAEQSAAKARKEGDEKAAKFFDRTAAAFRHNAQRHEKNMTVEQLREAQMILLSAKRYRKKHGREDGRS